jgi:UDP-glucuronate 4-epimerase
VRGFTKGATLVTGAAGFIGSHLVQRLLAGGERLICLDNLDGYYAARLKRQNLREALGGDESCFVRGDFRDRRLLEELFGGGEIGTVVHMGARPGVRASLEEPGPYIDINVTGTLELLEACRSHGVRRFVFASSSSVYGAASDGRPAVEDVTPLLPLSPYGASKVAGEGLCSAYAHLTGMTVIALRFFTVYGPRQRPDMAIRRFVQMIEEGREVPVYGDGHSLRDYTFVSDTVSGIEAALTAEAAGYRVVNLGRGEPVELLELIGVIEAALGKKAKLRSLPEQPGDPAATCADISRARELLGYAPAVTIEEGVSRFVRWFRGEGGQSARQAEVRGSV